MRARPERLDRLPEQYFTVLLARVAAAAARDGEPLVDLGRGNPDIGPPAHVAEALDRAARRPDTHGYAPFAGLPALKEAIAERYRTVYGVDREFRPSDIPLAARYARWLGWTIGAVYARDATIDPSYGKLLQR